MSETCQTCKHWFPRVGAGNVGICRRFPATVTTKPIDLCGEWQPRGPDLRTFADVRTMELTEDLPAADAFKSGIGKAVERIERVKKGGKR